MQTAGSSDPLPALSVHSSLKEEQNTAVWRFLDSLSAVSYQQFPECKEIEKVPTLFFIATSGDAIQGYAAVQVKRSVLAVLVHGPLAITEAVQRALLQFVLQHLRSRGISLFRWMPPHASFGAETVLNTAGKELRDSTMLHWATHHVPLSVPPEQLLHSFSEHHRRAIKKGVNLQLQVAEITSASEIEAFAKGYMQMFRHRGHKMSDKQTRAEFRRLHQFISRTGRGFFLGAKKDEHLVGGICVLYGGTEAFYHRGFLDHTYHDIPVNHLVFYHAMLKAREAGKAVFNMGGFALDPADDQMQNINRFKAGFKGDLVLFPPTRLLALNRIGGVLYRLKGWVRP